MSIRLLADAPLGWSDVPLKRLVRFGAGATPDSDNPEFWSHDDEAATPWVSIGDMSQRDVVTGTAKSLTHTGLASKRLVPGQPGTLLFAMYASVGETAFLTTSATWNQAILGLTACSKVELRFVRYALISLRPYLGSEFRSNTQNNLNAQQVGDLVLPTPPFEKQRAIADFLERETAKIDALIEKQGKLVNLLRERRQATIESAVTRGLRGERLRVSGVPWIGDVPEGWAVTHLRRHAAMRTGHTPSKSEPTYWEDCTIPWFTLADVWQLRSGTQKYLGETKQQISKLGLANSSAELLPAGTVVLSRTASVGFSGIMPVPMTTSQDFWNWVCRPSIVPEYLLYVFRTMKSEFEALKYGSTHQTIYQGDAASFQVPLPPIDEQREIVEYLDDETARIDVLIAKAEEFVALVKERRAALITAAVTGQIDVLGEAS